MWLIDQIAEKHIVAAQKRGEFDNLPGQGKPLHLEDDSMVPKELRTGYRLLKNAGYMPPELEMHKEALQLSQLLSCLDPATDRYLETTRRLRVLEIKLKLAGLNLNLQNNAYKQQIQAKLK
ncbi:DUF1992 domain-containing protein [Orbaceae bacterium ESL0727]|nr:DUF1992 domain-containing protein [Orbaceae bacterium ESL0727]